MTDGHVGRLLVAAMHQAITDELPMRLDFYEHWLGGERLRDGGVGLAPMTAVLGFLRAEGEPYHRVMKRAGQFAADWTKDAMPTMRRRWILMMPRWWRSRAVLRLAANAVRDGYASSRAIVRVRRGTATIEIKQSLFCRVRETQRTPQCDFHAAFVVGLLQAFNLGGSCRIDACSGTGDSSCSLVIDLTAMSTGDALEAAA